MQTRRGFFGVAVGAIAGVFGVKLLPKEEVFKPVVLKAKPLLTEVKVVYLSDEYYGMDEQALSRFYAKWYAQFSDGKVGKPVICGPCEVKQLG